MTNAEAKIILSAYRPDGRDAQSPPFQEALAQAQRDPELAAWLATERALDAKLGAKLKVAIKPPAELKAALLAQHKLVRVVPWWRKPVWLAVAAAACLLAVVVVSQLLNPSAEGAQFAAYRRAMAAAKIDRLDVMSTDVQELRRWLSQTNAHGDFVLPAGLAGKSTLGCRLLEWKGQKVSLLCFELANKQVAHLLIIDRLAFTDAPAESPQFVQVDGVATVAWSRGAQSYMIVSKGASAQDLLKLL